jgi:hypothetical protein
MTDKLPQHCFNEGEPYPEYIKLSDSKNNQTIIDIGTYKGYSAFSFSSNRTNKVYTFDIDNYVDIELPSNVTTNLKGALGIKPDLIKKADIILLDVDPHDGLKEPEIFKHIVESEFKGLLICDDVNLSEEMRAWWDSIDMEKEIVLWHHSGTGLIKF